MIVLRGMGTGFLRKWEYSRDIAAVVWGVLQIAARPRFWRRTTRSLLAKQILFTGVEALGLILSLGVVAGIAVVAQAQYWLSSLGQSTMLGHILVAVIIRELGPLLVIFVVIARSGTAIAAELANMRVRREIGVLEAQGVDPMAYLVMPRVLGLATSIFSLTIILISVSLGTGFLFGVLLGVTPGDPSLFLGSVLGAIAPADLVNLLAKTTVAGCLIGSICAREGLFVQASVTDVPRAVTRGVVRSIAAVLLVSVIASVLTYV